MYIDELSQYNKKQIDFLLAMIETDNIKKSAKIAQISEPTAYNYLKNGLLDEIKKIRKKFIEESFNKLEYASVKATDTIINILEDEKSTSSIKLNASKTILDYSLKIREQTEIIEKLTNIEKRINDDK